MRRFILAFVTSAVLSVSIGLTASAKEMPALSTVQLGPLTVKVDDAKAEFEVIDARMDETATAAVFFGLIGAAVNSASNNSEDDAKAAPLLSTAAVIDLDGIVAGAVQERLASRGVIALAPTPEGAANTLLVEIGEWGLVRKAQLPDKSMRAFLKLNVSILDAKGKPVWGPQREHSIGQMTANVEGFTPETFKPEMEALAVRAGQQVANKLNYR